MATIDLGRVTPIYRGEYVAATTYELNDIVLYNGDLYWHVGKTPTTGTAPTDTAVWNLAFSGSAVKTAIEGYASAASDSAASAAGSADTAGSSASAAAESAGAASEAQVKAETAQEAAEAAKEASAASAEQAAAALPLDTTLSLTGKAADAGAVGAAVDDLKSTFNGVSGADIPAFTAGGLHAETGIEYDLSTRSRTTFIQVEPNSYITFLFPFSTPNFLRIYEFADNTPTTEEVNTKLNTQYAYNGDTCQMSAQTNFIRIQVDAAPSAVTGVVLLRGGGYQRNQFLGLNYNDATPIAGTSEAHADLNDYMTPGNYVVVSAALAAFVDNAPLTNVGYKLVVMQTSGFNRIFQLLIPNLGQTLGATFYYRNYNGEWNSWKEVANKEYVDNFGSSILARCATLLASDATTLNNGTDLNSISTPGAYLVASTESAATMINAPTLAVGYKLVHFQTTLNTRLYQIAFVNSGGVPTIYIRNKPSDAGWTSWRLLSSDANTVTSSSIYVTSDNYTAYFPTAKFSDITYKTIMHIGNNVPLTDGPTGDEWIGTPDRTSGYITGTLVVYTPIANPQYEASGLVQLLIGYRSTDYKPTLSYRIAKYTNDAYVWSNWSKFEENGYLHASNMIVYGGSMDKTFRDMDDMPPNTIAQLDLNLNGSDSAHTLAHHPAPGVSCVAMCYAFSYTSRHGKVQTVYTIDGRFYWRYGYLQDVGDYRWTNWRQTVTDDGSLLRNKGRLANGTNINSIIDNAIYLLGAQENANYVNNAVSSGAAYLTVKTNNAIVFQTVESLGGARYSRYSNDTGVTWSSWVT